MSSRCPGVSGASVSTRFGPVQVEVTLGANKTICDVNAVAYPSADRKSLAINRQPNGEAWSIFDANWKTDLVNGLPYGGGMFWDSFRIGMI